MTKSTVQIAIVLIAANQYVFAAPSASEAQSKEIFTSKVQPLLKKLCFDCHSAKTAKGDFRLDSLNADLVEGNDAESWHDALNRINLGEMPPKKSVQPTSAERKVIVDWLNSELRRAAAAKRTASGRVILRRLTRYEYHNTMRDLLGVELDYSAELPPEPLSPSGFLNDAATLEMSPTQLEAYLRAARRALSVVIVDGDEPERYIVRADKTAVGKLPKGTVAGHAPANPEFAVDIKEYPRVGEFRLQLKAHATVPNGEGVPRIRVMLGHQPGIIHVPRKLVGEIDITGTPEQPQTIILRGRIEDFPQPGDVPFGNVNFKGMVALIDYLDAEGRELRYADRTYVDLPTKNKKAKPKPSKGTRPAPPAGTPRLDIVIQSAEFEAPVFESWPPKNHVRILPPQNADEPESEYAQRILAPFMTRAFRRPATRAEVETTAKLFEAIRMRSPTLIEALRETLASVLVSPHFLYVVESRTDANDNRVGQFELANRLSYFLWSSMPDQQLIELANSGKLRDPATLTSEVNRMLADARSTEFVTRFADQWFDLGALDRVAVNPEFFPGFDDALKDDMRQEARQFLAEILHGDSSCLELIDSDWTMLNRPLAQHYGITDGPKSSRFERVRLPADSKRGGVLGQAAFLLANSTGESSHPIKRAVWILDRLLDSPPAPPPPDVPELNEDSPSLAGLSLKEQLAVHREKEACANCHRGIDPWGIPLENFDAIGRWRTEVKPARLAKGKKNVSKSKPVDAASQLPDGSRIDGFESIKAYLLEHRRKQFARSVVKRLMAYGLGRSLDLGDREDVQQLQNEFVKADFRLKSLIVGFVKSAAFQTK